MMTAALSAEMARDMRRLCAYTVQRTLVRLRSIGAAIDQAEDHGQPTVALRDQWRFQHEYLKMCWPAYRRSARLAAFWHAKNRQRIAARGGRA